MDRTHVMQTLHNVQIQWSVLPKLNILVYFVHALHAFLYRSYATTPNDVNGYLEGIHQSFWWYLNMMQNCVSKIGDIDFSSLEWAGSKDEVGKVFRQGKVALNVRECRK